MTALPQLASRLHEIAWSAVQGPAADPWTDTGGTREERRSGSLQLLTLYSQLIKVLQRRIDLAIKDALDAGSDYGQIATACGVSPAGDTAALAAAHCGFAMVRGVAASPSAR